MNPVPLTGPVAARIHHHPTIPTPGRQSIPPSPVTPAATGSRREPPVDLYEPASTDLGGTSMEDLLKRLPEDVRNEVRRFVEGEVSLEHFSPERTAGRIADFALSGFARFEGGAAAKEGTTEARQRFVDFIMPAIDRGYAEALDLLGELDEKVLAGLEETRAIVGDRLQSFVETEPTDLAA